MTTTDRSTTTDRPTAGRSTTDTNTGTDSAPGVALTRFFTRAGVDPYSTVEWSRRDVIQTDRRTGDVLFAQRGVEFPSDWSENAVQIVTTKYFRGALDTAARESSLRQLVDRVVDTYTRAGWENGYFTNPETARVFSDELKWMLIHQMFSFNSPVWFNVGTTSPQQVSACFILAVDDSMDSILNWYREEGLIFKGGSGAGLNLSRIRSSKELLKSSGGTASGPVSFMRGADASAGTIKSGGATRRAAKMVVLDVDHPDIEEFVNTKAHEEDKIRALRDAGFDMDLGGKDIISVQYQNANNSVRVSDEFMKAVAAGGTFDLKARTTGQTVETVDAGALFDKIALAAWACADPGIQYDDMINAWHTNPNTGRINASNPCSEYMSVDNSSCNLASINLLAFLTDDGQFHIPAFRHAVELIITAMDISICFADFPTKAIGDTTRAFRQLGIGYANLGALLMRLGLAYDSPQGRTLAASITALMTGVAYRRSAELAEVVGPYDGFAENQIAHTSVMDQHRAKLQPVIAAAGGSPASGQDLFGAYEMAASIALAASVEWDTGIEKGERSGWRNAQASLLAPTGTIGFMMDCDTTGIEPDFSLVKFKKLVGGGSMQIVNQQVPASLESLGYSTEQVDGIVDYIAEHGHVVDAPGLDRDHYRVFDCAMGQRAIAPMGHVRMMAAVQPFLSGAISKTVNVPESATVDEVRDMYFVGWEMGLKALAIYRDNCKVGQPLDTGSSKAAADSDAPDVPAAPVVLAGPRRERLPASRAARTTSFNVGGTDGYLTSGAFPDGRVGEIFLKMSKQGSTLSGMMDAFSIAVSIGLQYGVPLEQYVQKFTNMRFEPAGITSDPDVRMSQSIMDYVFRRLALDYLPTDVRSGLAVLTAEERHAVLAGEPMPTGEPVSTSVPALATEQNPGVGQSTSPGGDAQLTVLTERPMCMSCHTSAYMRPTGSCWLCENCYSTTGCSG